MPKLIDKESVIAMSKLNFTQAEIAKRNGCSERQVRRIIKDASLSLSMTRPIPKLKEKDAELTLRSFFLSFESAAKVGTRFGLTRQAILIKKI